ncbi:MAG TPA: hypothetical protein VFV66_01400 [Nonomuraea sp.]|nr:hypothetical protein [Nonomuraea sp.]
MLITENSPAGEPRGSQLLALRQVSYAIEAELIRYVKIPRLYESLDDLRAQPLSWLGAMVEGDRLAGRWRGRRRPPRRTSTA